MSEGGPWVIASAHGYYVGPQSQHDRAPKWARRPSTTWWYHSLPRAQETASTLGIETHVVPFASVPKAPYRVEAVDLPNGRTRWEFVTPDGSEPLCVDHDHEDSYTLRHCEHAAARAEVIMLFGALEEGILKAARIKVAAISRTAK